MTRPGYQLDTITIEGADGDSGFRGEWNAHNSVDGQFIPEPVFVEVEEPGTGKSSRSLPPEHRTRPVVFVYDQSDIAPEWSDVTWSAQDYEATVRLEIVVSGDMREMSGKQMREAIVQVLENIREANSAPVGGPGVFGSHWRAMKVVNIDRSPERFSSHWRAYYDIQYEALSVI